MPQALARSVAEAAEGIQRLAKLYHQTSASPEAERRRLNFLSATLWRQIRSQALDTEIFDRKVRKILRQVLYLNSAVGV